MSKPIGVTPFPIRSEVVNKGAFITIDWSQWLNGLRAALNLTPGNSVASTFSALPASPAEGTLAVVTDSTVNTWGSVIAGLGGFRVLAYWNGTNWTVAAK